jgi:hypothetical protein
VKCQKTETTFSVMKFLYTIHFTVRFEHKAALSRNSYSQLAYEEMPKRQYLDCEAQNVRSSIYIFAKILFLRVIVF